MAKWIPPIRIELSKDDPKSWGDFVWGSTYLFVSDQFRLLYEREGLTGITKFHPPAEIVRVGKKHVSQLKNIQFPKYYAIEVMWNGADMDDQASGLVLKEASQPLCSFCRLGSRSKLERIVIRAGSWTGADVFTPRGGPVEHMVSRRFRDAVLRHELKNVWFVPADKWAFDESRVPPLSTWFVRE
jgi:hypothetical protein